ncbi:MAG: MBL fold metallo-hydrolase [Propionibacteriaceae bacterium]|nr:MBL fold metallo-hydrolase [Propionibacteriaceae bacterium]
MTVFEQVRPGLFSGRLEVEDTCFTVIVGQEGAMVVDTGSHPHVGTNLRHDISQTFEVPLTHVVLTHGHWDHSFGTPAFSDLQFLAHENYPLDVQCLENQAQAQVHNLSLDTLPTPTALISSIKFVDLGDQPVEIAYLGQAHSRSDLVLGLPKQQGFIVGDLVDCSPPQCDETSSLHGWVQVLDVLYTWMKPDTLLLPGHGRILDVGDLTHFRSGLAALWDQTQWAHNQGIPVGEIYDHSDLQWPWDRETAKKAITVAYQELTASLL